MLTNFGMALRQVRQEQNELLKDMADKLGISSSDLSSIETGRTAMSDEMFEKLFSLYTFTSSSWSCMRRLFEESKKEVKPEFKFMGKKFITERGMKNYKRIYEMAKEDGCTDEELETPYLDRLHRSTKSSRILRFIKVAYYLGWLRGIAYEDEGHTKIGISPIERIQQVDKSALTIPKKK